MTAEHHTRYFEFQDEKSAKFWEVSQAGNVVRVRYGKLGTNGQSQEKSFLDEAKAINHVNKIIKEKIGKGYIEINNKLSTSSEQENIMRNTNSRQRWTIYESMSIDDFNLVLDNINRGAKAMSQFGFLSEDQDCSILGRYDLLSYDPDFVPFNVRVLQLGETVYTGGTGESYDFAIDMAYVCSDLNIIYHDEGASSPEDCLRTILHHIRMACRMNELENSSDVELLEFLQKTANTCVDDKPRLPIIFSPSISINERQPAIDLANEIGAKVIDLADDWFVYVLNEYSVVDDAFAGNATVVKTMQELMDDMRKLKDWQLHRLIKSDGFKGW